MKYRKTTALALLLCAAVCILCSCFAGAQDDRSTAGERDGVLFCYLEDEGLLILSSSDRIAADSRIFSLPFTEGVRYIYLSAGTHSIDEDVPNALKGLIKIFCADPVSAFPAGFASRANAVFSFDTFESRTDLPFGHAIGHCPSGVSNKCLICGLDYRYDYSDHRCGLIENQTRIRSRTVTAEGKELSFDENGYLIFDGFLSLGGEKRFYENGVYAIGKKEIGDIRYTFSSEGALTNERKRDESIPAYQIVLPVAAVLLGGGVCFGVYRFARHIIKKEEEEET